MSLLRLTAPLGSSPEASGLAGDASCSSFGVRLRLVFDPALDLALHRLGSGRLLLALPPGLHLVADFERHLRERFALPTVEAQSWCLAVGSFTLPSDEQIVDVLRDGDVVDVHSASSALERRFKTVANNMELPARKRQRSNAGAAAAAASVAIVADAAATASRALAEEAVVASTAAAMSRPAVEEDPREKAVGQPKRKRRAEPAPQAESTAEPSRPPAESVAVTGEAATTPKLASTAVAAAAAAVASTPQAAVAATQLPRQTASSDGQSGVFVHPLLGMLEVPEGMDRTLFVNRKLKTLRVAVRRQVEHYFGDRNWERDEHLRKLADADGFVEISAVAQFERLQCLTTDVAFIAASLKDSSVARVSSCGGRLQRCTV